MSSAINKTRGKELSGHVRVATSLVGRLRGLLGTKALPEGESLWIAPCQSVHTFFMRYPIDVLFISPKGEVLHATTLPPWRTSRWVHAAAGVLELPAGTLAKTQTVIRDQIALALEGPR